MGEAKLGAYLTHSRWQIKAVFFYWLGQVAGVSGSFSLNLERGSSDFLHSVYWVTTTQSNTSRQLLIGLLSNLNSNTFWHHAAACIGNDAAWLDKYGPMLSLCIDQPKRSSSLIPDPPPPPPHARPPLTLSVSTICHSASPQKWLSPRSSTTLHCNLFRKQWVLCCARVRARSLISDWCSNDNRRVKGYNLPVCCQLRHYSLRATLSCLSRSFGFMGGLKSVSVVFVCLKDDLTYWMGAHWNICLSAVSLCTSRTMTVWK